jgi:hypothetical protein
VSETGALLLTLFAATLRDALEGAAAEVIDVVLPDGQIRNIIDAARKDG